MLTLHPILNLFSGLPKTGFRRCFLRHTVSNALDAHLEFGHKAAELLVPVVECGCGRDDEEWAPDVVSLQITEYTHVWVAMLQDVLAEHSMHLPATNNSAESTHLPGIGYFWCQGAEILSFLSYLKQWRKSRGIWWNPQAEIWDKKGCRCWMLNVFISQ